MQVARIILIGLMAVAMGCAPRGESKSLDEVVTLAKTRFSKVQGVSLDPAVKAILDPVVRSLEDLVNNPRGGGISKNAKVIADSLSNLVEHASYTNRPAMGEILSQYLVVGSKPASEVNDAAVRLLAARTYSLLASELETRKFNL